MLPPKGFGKREHCFDAYRGTGVGEASNPGPGSVDDAESIADSDYWPDPELQWALEDGADRGDEMVLGNGLVRPPAPPELEELAVRAQTRRRPGCRARL